jgi:hypothetical protein
MVEVTFRHGVHTALSVALNSEKQALENLPPPLQIRRLVISLRAQGSTSSCLGSGS